MVTPIITVLGSEQSVTTATALSGAKLLRIYNAQATDVVVTITTSADVTVGTITVPTKQVLFLDKNPTDKIACASACLVVPIGY